MFLHKVSNLFEEDLFDYQGRQMKEPLIINFLYCLFLYLIIALIKVPNGLNNITSAVSINKVSTTVFYWT